MKKPSNRTARAGVIYKTIARFPGYKFGSDGTVVSIKSGHNLLRPSFVRSDGYAQITLWINGIRNSGRVHRLVLEAFRGPCPAGMQAAHLNGDPGDNRLSNLKWATQRENETHKYWHGRATIGANNGKTKLSEANIIEIRERWMSGESGPSIAARFGINRCHPREIASRRYWRQVPDPPKPARRKK